MESNELCNEFDLINKSKVEKSTKQIELLTIKDLQSMKTNKLNNLRAEQKAELSNIEIRLAEIETARKNFFANTTSEERERLFSTDYNAYENIMKHKEEKKLKERKEVLEIEVLEKKYANELFYSDVEPYEVIEEKTADKYLIRQMKCNETEKSKVALQESFVEGGFCGHFDNDAQEWEITSDVEAPVFEIRRHKDGYFYHGGRRFNITASPVKVYDFNF